jgi:hypothetical protein
MPGEELWFWGAMNVLSGFSVADFAFTWDA